MRSPDPRPGPLAAIRVVEFASEFGAFAGKLLADLGAEVILVEPPGGHRTRWYPPFEGDQPGTERSLWWRHYQTNKRSVVLDPDSAGDSKVLRRLIDASDVVLDAEGPSVLGRRGLGWEDLRDDHARLVWVSVTSFGRDDPRSEEPFTDLTLMAGSGPVWSCGYDDHELPPVRAGGNQISQIAGLWAANATLIALLARRASGRGQLVDVSMHAAGNIATEGATIRWLVAGQTVQRQTCRHAGSPVPSAPTTARAADGMYVNTTGGVPPRNGAGCASILRWLEERGLAEEFDRTDALVAGSSMAVIPLPDQTTDPLEQAVVGAMRDALALIASTMEGKEFFLESQTRQIATAVILAPEEALMDEHLSARGFPVPVQGRGGNEVIYPGAPFRSEVSPWRIEREAPLLDEHATDVRSITG